jgi:hypothetical protein
MSRYTLEHYYEVVPNTKEGALSCLSDLAICDNDFNGENGLEYLWDEAEGFVSNAEYCLSIAEQEPTPREMVEKFISLWMSKDHYYEDYDLGILVRDGNLFISLAYTTRG